HARHPLESADLVRRRAAGLRALEPAVERDVDRVRARRVRRRVHAPRREGVSLALALERGSTERVAAVRKMSPPPPARSVAERPATSRRLPFARRSGWIAAAARAAELATRAPAPSFFRPP